MRVSLFDIAQRFVGVKEIPGKVDNPQILAMLRLDQAWPAGDEVPWCSAFLNYCAWLLRLPRSKSLAARSWLSVGVPVPLTAAVPGFDVAVLWRGNKDAQEGHVGLFAALPRDGSVELLGGNQGDSVSIAPFDLNRVLGVRRLRSE